MSRGCAVIRHGAFSVHVRHKYSDLRTTEGRTLAGIINGIIDDLGGQEALSASQRLILDGMKSKLIVILQVSAYVDKQPSLVGEDGEVLSCLRRTLLSYQAELRRDLELLHGMDRRQRKPGGGLADWIKEQTK